jgi:uncharacterized membrane protein YgaE (UPF0421/DUF939 family)
MKLIGFSFHEFLKIGIAASLFILIAKWLGPKTKVPAIAATTERI